MGDVEGEGTLHDRSHEDQIGLLPGLSTATSVIFFGIGGGSDVDTCSIFERSLEIPSGSPSAGVPGSSVCPRRETAVPALTLVSLGPRSGESLAQSTARYSDRYRPCRSIQWVDPKTASSKDGGGSNPTAGSSTHVLLSVDDCAMLEAGFIFAALSGDGTTVVPNVYGVMVREDTLSALGDVVRLLGERLAQLRAADSSGAESRAQNSCALIAVDTGGDCLAPLFERTAPEDLWADEETWTLVPAWSTVSTGTSPSVTTSTSAAAAVEPAAAAVLPPTADEPFAEGKPLLVRKGMSYVPTGTGFGDYSNFQFAYGNEKRDEFALRVCCASGLDWWLYVVGLGSDGETSVEGLVAADKLYSVCFWI